MVKDIFSREKISVMTALQVVGLKRSTYYYENKPNDRRKKPLDENLVKKLHSLSGYELTYGYRKVTVLFDIYNHKKVYRHMKELSILQPKKIKKQKHTRLPIVSPIDSNIRWEADLTYVYDGSKINYLFAITDAYDKEIIGDHYGLRCRSDEAVKSLEKAVLYRFGSLQCPGNRNVTLRVDQGSQYVSKKFKNRARELGIKLEYCGIDCPNDKPYIESFFSRYKCEEVYRNEYTSFTQALQKWNDYKYWYNTKRIHQGLNWMTITEFINQRNLQVA